ncbi:hypothetical protein [Thalassiella azotivora]
MNRVLRPVGPEESSVYWRRRALALVLLVALVLGGWFLVRAVAGDDTPDGAPTAQDGEPQGSATDDAVDDAGDEAGDAEPGAGAGEEPAPETTPEVPPCEPATLQVTATADATTYPEGVQPTLGMRIRNVGDAECTVDAGSAALELLVVSGADRIWSSDDCQEDSVNDVQVVPPGAELVSSVQWPRQRSAPGCPADLPQPRPGTYQLTGRAGEITSEPLAFDLG